MQDGQLQNTKRPWRWLIRSIMHQIIKELLSYRDLLWMLTLRDIRIRYKQAAMGFIWTFFISAIRFAVQSLVGNRELVTKIYFPRVVLPLASVLACLFDFLISVVV